MSTGIDVGYRIHLADIGEYYRQLENQISQTQIELALLHPLGKQMNNIMSLPPIAHKQTQCLWHIGNPYRNISCVKCCILKRMTGVYKRLYMYRLPQN